MTEELPLALRVEADRLLREPMEMADPAGSTADGHRIEDYLRRFGRQPPNSVKLTDILPESEPLKIPYTYPGQTLKFVEPGKPVVDSVREVLARHGIEAPEEAITSIAMAATFAAGVALGEADREAADAALSVFVADPEGDKMIADGLVEGVSRMLRDAAYDALTDIIERHAPDLHGCAKSDLHREIVETWLPSVRDDGEDDEDDTDTVMRGFPSAGRRDKD